MAGAMELLEEMGRQKRDDILLQRLFSALESGDEPQALRLMKEDRHLAQMSHSDKRTASWVAARQGLAKALAQAAKRHPESMASRGPAGVSVVEAAALSGSVPCVELALEARPAAGLLVEAIRSATLAGRRDALLALLQAASPEVAQVAAWGAQASEAPCVETAISQGQGDCALALAEWAGPLAAHAARQNANKALAAASRAGEQKAARGLASLADVNAVDASGWTPLALSALSGSKETVQALLDAGADPNALAPSGKTALMLAIEGGGAGQLSCAEVLAQVPGADLSIQAQFNIFGIQTLDAQGLARALGRMDLALWIERVDQERHPERGAAARALAERVSRSREQMSAPEAPARKAKPSKRP